MIDELQVHRNRGIVAALQTSAPAGSRIVLTDPPPLPRRDRCPWCDAKRDQWIDTSGFGPVKRTSCGVCGAEVGGEG